MIYTLLGLVLARVNEERSAVDEDRFPVDEAVHDERERGGADVFRLAGTADGGLEAELGRFHAYMRPWREKQCQLRAFESRHFMDCAASYLAWKRCHTR